MKHIALLQLDYCVIHYRTYIYIIDNSVLKICYINAVIL